MRIGAPDINFAHLDALSPRIEVDGRSMLTTWIYADAPTYTPVGDPDEGIACVDDVARAAVAYLDEHARTGSSHALTQARGALEFTLYMQEPDGGFVNFITDTTGTKNREHETSRAGLGWWAFRGMWALARGYREFEQQDPAFAARLLEAYGRTEGALVGALAESGGASIPARDGNVPAWLGRFSPDVASVAAIALAEMQEARPNDRTRGALATVADGIAASSVRRGTDGAFEHAGHTIANPELWHAWGAHEGEALARAGQLLDRPDLIDAARREAEGLMAWQLAAGRVHELTPGPLREGQQAYGVTMAVRGAMALHRATGDDRYARMAGLHASWFAGNNMAQLPMYDAATGRGYDGIDALPRGRNMSSGAESTIEAIMARQAIASSDDARRMAGLVQAAPPRTWTQVRADAVVADGPQALPLVSRPSSGAPGSPAISFASLAPGARASFEVQVDEPGDFLLLASRMRDAAPDGTGTTLQFGVEGQSVASLPPSSGGATGGHVALDRMLGEPVRLERGTHRIWIEASGPNGAAPALLNGVVVHPTVARTELVGPSGRVTLSYDVDAGRLDIE